MSDEKKPGDIDREIDETDLEGRVLKAAPEVTCVANSIDEKLRAIERTSGLSPQREYWRMFEENSVVRRAAESIRLLEESAGVRQFHKQMLFLEENSRMKRSAEQMRRVEEASGLRQFAERMRLFEENSAFKRITEQFAATGELARSAMGPMWELREAGVLAALPGHREMDGLRKAMEGFESRFILPELSETTRLAKMLTEQTRLARLHFEDSGIAQAIERINTPWLDVQDKLRSFTGFAEMQGIGTALRDLQGFDEGLSTTLRKVLGDWRDQITWRPEVLENLTARSEFYISLGFDPSLTDFPLPAFEQSLDAAGLREEVPPLIAHYGLPVPCDGDDEEEGLARTNTAHDWLQRLERLLRRFMDEQLTRAFGSDWPKRRMPPNLFDKWVEKKRKAMEAGGPDLPLICYADFTDYSPIICKDENWRVVFAPFFKRPESVRESFQRLHPIRLDTAHARLITQDDELLLYVEVKRLYAAIRT